MPRLIWILLFVLCTSSLAKDKAPPPLPDFKTIAFVSSKTRKLYLREMVKLINHKKFGFLDDLVLTEQKRFFHSCFPAIYGTKATLTNRQKKSRVSCRPDFNSASAFFIDPNNQLIWDKFRIKLALTCQKSKDCQNFLKAQHKINEKVLAKKPRKK